MKLRNSRIAKRLILFLLCILAPIILINVAVNIYNMMALRRETLNSSERLFTALADEFEGTLANIQTNAYVLSSDIGLKALNAEGAMTPARILEHYEQIVNLGYIARSSSLDMEINVYLFASGKVISSGGTMMDAGEIHAQEAKAAGAAGIWTLTRNHKGSAFLSYRYYAPSSSGGMVISMDIPTGSVKAMLEAVRKNDCSGSFLLFNDGSALFADEISGGSGGLRALVPGDGSLFISAADPNGNIMMIRPICGGMLSFCASFSEEKMMEASRMTVVLSTVVILLSSFLGVLLIGLAYRVLVKPIQTLVNAMKDVGNNNLNIEIPLESQVDTQDEIGFMYAQFNAMVSKLQNLINEVYLQKIYNQEMRLSMYQAQINPHFLHNCLNFISQSAMANSDEYTARMSRFLSKYFRYNIASEDLTTKVSDELEVLVAYMEIQKIRFPGRVDYSVRPDNSAYNCIIPKLSIQPLVENCFVHALNKMKKPLFIGIDISDEGGRLLITVRDNSGIMTREKIEEIKASLNENLENTANLGLKNIHNRVRSMYGDGSGLEIEAADDGGFAASIRISAPKRGA